MIHTVGIRLASKFVIRLRLSSRCVKKRNHEKNISAKVSSQYLLSPQYNLKIKTIDHKVLDKKIQPSRVIKPKLEMQKSYIDDKNRSIIKSCIEAHKDSLQEYFLPTIKKGLTSEIKRVASSKNRRILRAPPNIRSIPCSTKTVCDM